ncbi:MAG: HYC_CC_PP family protein [Chitinophagaceae bacterium]
MKKILVLLLLFVHTLASAGVVLSAHYCMGDFAGISIGETEQDGCGTCGMKDGGCCHNTISILKIDNSDLQKTGSIQFSSFSFTPLTLFPAVWIKSSHYNPPVTGSQDTSPPPIYLMHRNFRI